MKLDRLALALSAAAALAGCNASKKAKDQPAATPGSGSPTMAGSSAPPPAAAKHDRLSRTDFNRLAAERALPLFWRADADGDHDLEPDELVTYWGLPGPTRATLIAGDRFTPAFDELYAKLGPPPPPA